MGSLLTNAVEVQHLISVLLRIYAISTIPDGMQAILGMVLRVCTYQKMAVSVYLVETLLFTTPLGMILAFPCGWGVKGFWASTVFGTVGGFCVLAYFSTKLNLENEIARSKARIDRDKERPINIVRAASLVSASVCPALLKSSFLDV